MPAYEVNSRDARSFEAATLPLLDELYQSAHALLGSEGMATEVVEKVYLKAWQSYSGRDLGAACRIELFSLLFAEILNRRGAKRCKTMDDPGLDTLRILREMPPPDAELMVLADVHEFSCEEIHQILGMPARTVATRLQECREQFRMRTDLGAGAGEAAS